MTKEIKELPDEPVHRLLGKWMSRKFYYFKDCDNENFSEDNIVAVDFNILLKNYGNGLYISNIDDDLKEDELNLLNSKLFRDSIYFKSKASPNI